MTPLGVARVFLPSGKTGRQLPARLWGALPAGSPPGAPAPLVDPGVLLGSAARFDLSADALAAARIPATEVPPEALLPDASAAPRPAVIVSPGRGDPGWTGAGLCAALAAAGAFVAEVAHPGDGPTADPAGTPVAVPEDLRDPESLPRLLAARVADLTAASEAMRPGGALARFGVDPARIFGVGHSLGGAASAAAAGQAGFRGAVVLDGRLAPETCAAGAAAPLLLLTAPRDDIPGWAQVWQAQGTRGAHLAAAGAEHYAFTELASRPAELGLGAWSEERRLAWLGTGDAAAIRAASVALVLEFLGLSVPAGSATARAVPAGWELVAGAFAPAAA